MNYSSVKKSVDKVMRKTGQIVTLTKQTAGDYNAATGTATVTTTTQYAYGVVFDYGNRNIDGVMVKEGDKQLLLSALNTSGATLTAPAVNDTVTIGDVIYTITMVKATAPDGTIMMFECNLRA